MAQDHKLSHCEKVDLRSRGIPVPPDPAEFVKSMVQTIPHFLSSSHVACVSFTNSAGGLEEFPLRSAEFRHRLANHYYELYNRPLPVSLLRATASLLEARAHCASARIPTAFRLFTSAASVEGQPRDPGAFSLHLADPRNRALLVDPGSVEIRPDETVSFQSTHDTLPLAEFFSLALAFDDIGRPRRNFLHLLLRLTGGLTIRHHNPRDYLGPVTSTIARPVILAQNAAPPPPTTSPSGCAVTAATSTPPPLPSPSAGKAKKAAES